MSTLFNKALIPLARKSSKNFDLSCDHVTSQDFFQFQPVYIKPLMPGESISINLSHFSRLSSMVKPTYGHMRIEDRAFVVPYRTIFRYWNEFITNTSENTLLPSVPTVTNSVLWNFIDSQNADGTSTKHDYSYILNNTTKYRVFSGEGKFRLKILNSLGYKINLGVTFDKSEVTAYMNKKRSLLPYLAYLKIYFDWYQNSVYRTQLGYYLYQAADTNTFDANLGFMNGTFLQVKNVCYERDYFTAAWDNPSSPTVSNENIVLTDPSLTGTSNYKTGIHVQDGVPVLDARNAVGTFSDTYPRNESLTIEHLLHSVTSYLKRHQIAGNRVLDRFFAQWGIQLNDPEVNRSTYIGSHTIPLSIMDVISTSDTQGASLGEYAAKGIAASKSGHFNYKASEWCYVVIISSVLARQSNPCGSSAETYRTKLFDYFTPEFDGVGPEPIPIHQNKENFTNAIDFETAVDDNVWKSDGVFGFLPRYASYKASIDNLSGDFVVNTLRTDLDAFHTMRLLPDNGDTLSHSLEYTIGSQNQMDRIFYEQQSYFDHFFSVLHFDVKSKMPAQSLFNTFDFELDKEGKLVEVNNGGSRVN